MGKYRNIARKEEIPHGAPHKGEIGVCCHMGKICTDSARWDWAVGNQKLNRQDNRGNLGVRSQRIPEIAESPSASHRFGKYIQV